MFKDFSVSDGPADFQNDDVLPEVHGRRSSVLRHRLRQRFHPVESRQCAHLYHYMYNSSDKNVKIRIGISRQHCKTPTYIFCQL